MLRRELGAEHLDRQRLVDDHMGRAVDEAHPALADLAVDPVALIEDATDEPLAGPAA